AWACVGSWGQLRSDRHVRGQEVRRSHHASRVAVARMSAGRWTAIRPRVDKGDGARRPAGSPPHARGPGGAPSVAGENSAWALDVGGWADGIVVGPVRTKEPSQVALAEHDDVVEALAADGADEPFREGILPRRPGGDEDLANAHARDALGEPLVVDCISIAKEILRGGLFRERLNELPSGPDCRGMIRNVEVEELATVMSQDDEDEEQAEGEGGDNEEVNGDDVSGMRGKKGPPRRGGPRRRPVHILGDGQLGDGVAEQSEFGLVRRRPHVGFSRAIRRISRRIAAASRG